MGGEIFENKKIEMKFLTVKNVSNWTGNFPNSFTLYLDIQCLLADTCYHVTNKEGWFTEL